MQKYEHALLTKHIDDSLFMSKKDTGLVKHIFVFTKRKSGIG